MFGFSKVASLSSAQSLALAFLVLVILIAASGAALLLSRPDPVVITIHPPEPTSTPLPTPIPAPIKVYVTGAVALPEQVYQLPYGSRVADAIEAAGGFTDEANKILVNMAAILRDGDQAHAPFAGDEAASANLPTPPGGRRVYLNSATREELESLPGIGPETAKRIVEYRELAGGFENLNDLDNVSGIGPATLEKIADLVEFD